MTLLAGLFTRCYRGMLKLYPDEFRQEFGEELLVVFQMRMNDALRNSRRSVLLTGWRELRDLPAAVVFAHLRERRHKRMANKFEDWFSQTPGSWREILLAGLPIVLLAFVPGALTIIPAAERIPDSIGQVILLAIAAALIGFGIIGLLARLPRWSLVYAGILITTTAVIGLVGMNQFIIWPFPIRWGVWWTAGLLAVFLVILFSLVGLVVLAASRIRLAAPFFLNLRKDPTLIPFMMYGGSLVLVMLNYDEVDAGWLVMLSAVGMLAGAWGYLRSGSVRARLGSLFVGSTLACLAALAGNLFYSVLYDYGQVFSEQAVLNRVLVSGVLSWITCQVMIFFPMVFRGSSPLSATPAEQG